MEDRFEKFTTYIMQFNRYIQKIKEIEMKEFNLHANHTMCIYFLSKNKDGLTSTELVKLCKEDKAAISRSINYLIENDYIIRKENTDKKTYRSLLILTDKGNDLAIKMQDKISKSLNIGGNNLDEKTRETFYDTLNTIMQNLEQHYNLNSK